MARFHTFNPKVPKQTRSREIPDDKKMSYRSPLTANPIRHMDFKIQEIPKDIQVSKLARSLVKAKRHLRNLIEKRGRFPSQASYFEREILRTNEHIFNKEMKIALLNRALDTRDKRFDTKKENEHKAELARKKNGELALKFNPPKPVSGANSNTITKIEAKEMAEALFLKKTKVVKSSSGSKKIVRNRHKTWSKS